VNVFQTGTVPPPPPVQPAVPALSAAQPSTSADREATAREAKAREAARHDAAQERRPAAPPVKVLTLHDMRTILNLPVDARERRGSGPGGEQVDVYA
jgi:hypothetical protein